MRAAPPIVRPRRRRVCGDGHLRGARAPRAHGQGRGSRDEPRRRHDRPTSRSSPPHYFGTGEQPRRTGNDHALVAPYGLFDAQRRAGRDRAVQRHRSISSCSTRSVCRTCAIIPISTPMPTASSGARRSTRSINARDRQATDRALGRRAQRGGRAMRPRDEPRRSIRRSADAAPADADHDRPSGARQARRAGLSRSSSRDDPCRVHRPPPVLGADTDAILRELGYSRPGDRRAARRVDIA